MKCYTEEIFGPVLVAMNVDTLDDVSSAPASKGIIIIIIIILLYPTNKGY